MGFVDEVLGANEMAASISEEQLKRFNHVPEIVEKDVDKITKIDDIDTSDSVETPKKQCHKKKKKQEKNQTRM